MAQGFPSMKARALLAVLQRAPLSYRVIRQQGSHRLLGAEGRPTVLFGFHDRQTVSPRIVREYLVDRVGLTDDEAKGLL